MKNNQPLVSVFIPYYNDKDFLRDAIDAVFNQSYQNWELILFNHASTDGSRDIAHSYDDARIIHIDAKENLGAGSGYNLQISLKEMNGKYVKLLCADDMMKPDCLEVLVDYMEKHQDKDIVAADMEYVSETKEPLNTKWSKEIQKVDFVSDEKKTLLKFFKGYSHIAYPSTMVKLDALRSIDLDASLIMLFDVWLWVNLLISGKKIGFVNKCVINYRISDNQLSSVANPRAVKVGFFELFMLLESYYKIKDVDLIKYLVPSKYAKQLTKQDSDLIPFVLSCFFASVVKDNTIDFFKDQQNVREIFGNLKIYEIIQDKKLFEKINEKFGFGVKDFRSIYSCVYQEKSKPSFKQKVYNTPGIHLSWVGLLFLLFRKTYRFVLFPLQYKKNKKQKKSYTW